MKKNILVALTFVLVQFICLQGSVFSATSNIVNSGDAWTYTVLNFDLWSNWANVTVNSFDWDNPDNLWNSASAPFGSTSTYNTTWNVNTDLALYKYVDINGTINGEVTLNVAVDNGFIIFINGVEAARDNAEGFTSYWEYQISLSSSLFKQGQNLIQVFTEDHGDACFFDMQMTADISAVSVWNKVTGPWVQDCDGYFTSIAIDPSNSQTIYIGNSHSSKGCGIYKSIDGGQTWFSRNQGIKQIGILKWKHYPSVSKIAISNNPNILYFGSQNGYLYRSLDGGSTWVDARGNNRLGFTQIRNPVLNLAVDSNNSGIVYSGVQFQGVFKTTNMGNNWKVIRKGTPAIGATDYYSVLEIDPSNHQNILVAGYTAYRGSILPCGLSGQCISLNGVLPLGPYKSSDGGNTWTGIINRPELFDLVTDLKVAKEQSQEIFASTMTYMNPYGGTFIGNGIFRSLDGGVTWGEINYAGQTDLSQYPIYKLIRDSDAIYAICGFNGVFKTIDGGINWYKLTTQGLPSSTFITDLALSGQTLFVLTNNGVYQLK